MKAPRQASKPQKAFADLCGQLTCLNQQRVQNFISAISGLFEDLCFQRAPDSFHGYGGWVNGVMDPPSAVVVPQVMIEVRFVYAKSNFLVGVSELVIHVRISFRW
jgi:hypothetical protein